MFIAEVGSARQTKRKAFRYSAPLVEADLTVTFILKGNVDPIVKVESEGGDNGANCGLGKALLYGAKTKQKLVYAIDDIPKRGRSFVSGCTSGRIDPVSAEIEVDRHR